MRNKISLLIDNYIEDVNHFGEEQHADTALILNELKQKLSSLHEDDKDNCAQMIREFQESKPEHKDLLNDFLTYIKYSK